MFWVISVYFNIRNTLPKSGTFLLGHPVYIYIYMAHSTRRSLQMSAKSSLLQMAHSTRRRLQMSEGSSLFQMAHSTRHSLQMSAQSSLRQMVQSVIWYARNHNIIVERKDGARFSAPIFTSHKQPRA